MKQSEMKNLLMMNQISPFVEMANLKSFCNKKESLKTLF